MNTKTVPLHRHLLSNSPKQKRKPRKIVMIGSARSGKTSLIHRFLNNSFTDQHKPTVEGLYDRDCTYRGYNLNLDIVDTSEVFQFPDMRDLHIKTADVIMLVYEIENMKSVRATKKLYGIIRELREDKMPIILVGTKMDLKGGSLPDNFQESEEIVEILHEIQGAKHILTSAKYNMHVRDAFEYGFDDVIRKLHTLSMSVQRPSMCGQRPPLSAFSKKRRICCKIQ